MSEERVLRKTAEVPRKAPELGIITLCRLMDDCLPERLENEQDMQELINKLWAALVCEFEYGDES